ncbi:hypothetical protein RRG08_022187 [Elysia crispata]|uniref:Uncharacterized protein n=1 Tax=Elysia crispata TaxID=231223 RepID=A0AAE1CZ39_9GAST|nr:hypothetical protein RRG08_022187 [Elysia crispata]
MSLTTQTVGWQEKELSGRPIEREEQLGEAHAVYYQRGWYNSWGQSASSLAGRLVLPTPLVFRQAGFDTSAPPSSGRLSVRPTMSHT